MRCLKWLVLAALVEACAGPRRGELVMAVQYVPGTETKPVGVPPCAAPIQLSVVDERSNKDVFGRRFHEEHLASEFPIRGQGDFAAFVRSALERSMKQPAAAGPGVGLAVKVSQVILEEKIYYNSSYSGQLTFEATVTAPGSTGACWSKTLTGQGSNYGRAGSEENAQETLSHVVEDAAANLLKDPGFRDAVCGKCASP